jgi:hypothetical protein
LAALFLQRPGASAPGRSALFPGRAYSAEIAYPLPADLATAIAA